MSRAGPWITFAVLAALGTAGCWLVRAETFPGAATPSQVPAAHDWKRLTIPTDEGEVEAWFRRGAGRSAEAPGPAVLFSHGNGESVDDWLPMLDGYAARGTSVMTVEYRGYGRSSGTATEDHLVADAIRGFDLLIADPAVDRTRIALHGRSIGVGIICAVATRRAARALIAQSGFTSLPDVAWEQSSIPAFLVPDRFENERALRSLFLPVLVLHGDRDEVFGLEHARRLAKAAAGGAELRVYPCGHDDCEWQTMLLDIDAFLRSWL